MWKFAGILSKNPTGYKEAKRLYRKFLEWPDSMFYTDSMFELACILAKTPRGKKEAKCLCEKYLEKNPESTKALKLLEELN